MGGRVVAGEVDRDEAAAQVDASATLQCGAADEVGAVAPHEAAEPGLEGVELGEDVGLPMEVALLDPHRVDRAGAEEPQVVSLARPAQGEVGGVKMRVGDVDLVGELARVADAEHHRRGDADERLARREPREGLARPVPSGGGREHLARARPRQHQRRPLVRERADADVLAGLDVAREPVHVVQLGRRRGAVPDAAGEVGDRRLGLEHPAMVQQVGEPDPALAPRHPPADHPVEESVNVPARQLEAVEAADLGRAPPRRGHGPPRALPRRRPA